MRNDISESLILNVPGTSKCPFCDSDNNSIINRTSVVSRYKLYGDKMWRENIKEEYYVKCNDCYGHGPIKASIEESITAWNVK